MVFQSIFFFTTQHRDKTKNNCPHYLLLLTYHTMWTVLQFWKVVVFFFQVGIWSKSKVGVKSNHSSTGKSDKALNSYISSGAGGDERWRELQETESMGLAESLVAWAGCRRGRRPAWSQIPGLYTWMGEEDIQLSWGPRKWSRSGSRERDNDARLDISSLRCLWDNRMEKPIAGALSCWKNKEI